MVVTIFGGDLRTGLIRVRNIAAESGSCRTVLGAAGTISATVRLPMEDPQTGIKLAIFDELAPGRSFLGWEENGVILNAGPIWTDAYNFDTKRILFSAAGLRSYWQYRYVLPALDDLDLDDLPAGKDTIFVEADNLSKRTVAKRLIQQAQAWNGGSVPVVFEPDYPGDTARTYRGHELHVVDEKLKQLSEVIGGPDIMFNPRYTDDARTHIEWLMQTGDPQIHQLPIVTVLKNRILNTTGATMANYSVNAGAGSIVSGWRRASATTGANMYVYPTTTGSESNGFGRFTSTPGMPFAWRVKVRNPNATTMYVTLRCYQYLDAAAASVGTGTPVAIAPGAEMVLEQRGVTASNPQNGLFPLLFWTDASGAQVATPVGAMIDSKEWALYTGTLPSASAPIPFISGDMTDEPGVDYSYEGTANASPSLRTSTRIIMHKWDASGLPDPAIRAASLTRDATVLTSDNYQTGSVPEGTDEDPDPYPLMAKSADPYLWGPDQYGPWGTDRQNGALNPLQLASGSQAEVKPVSGFTASFLTGIVPGAPGEPTTACRFTRNAASPTTITAANAWYGDVFAATPGTTGDWLLQPVAPGRVRVRARIRSNRDSNFIMRIRPFNVATPAWTLGIQTGPARMVAGGAWTDVSWEFVAPAGSTHIAALITQQTKFAWALNDWWDQAELLVGDEPWIGGNTDIDETHRTRWAGAANASPTLFQTRSVVQPSRRFPRLETSTDRSSVINRPVLQDGADEATNVGRLAQETWKFEAKKDISPMIGDYGVGDFGVIVTKDDPRVGTGEHPLRILEIGSSLGNPFASLSCAPRREEIA